MIRNKEKGYNAFVSGMIALANKDYKRAILESKKISNHLDDNPSLALLLKSEIFKVEKKYDELSVVYEDMSKNKHTENLGYRGMMEQYLRAQDYHHAFIYGGKFFLSLRAFCIYFKASSISLSCLIFAISKNPIDLFS